MINKSKYLVLIGIQILGISIMLIENSFPSGIALIIGLSIVFFSAFQMIVGYFLNERNIKVEKRKK